MKKYYFVGIKGSGMSSLAQILHDNGEIVCGSDISEELFTEIGLRDRGIEIFNFNPSNIKDDYFYIIGNAFNDSHPEVSAILENKYDYMRYQEFLGRYLNNFVSVGISGAHGKTSTTSLLAHTLSRSLPTSYLIGDGTGVGHKDSNFFVFEACEYKRHFLSYKPDYAIITNIDFDHPDYFASLEDVKSAFISYASNAKKAVIVCGDDSNILSIIPEISDKKKVFTYGISETNDLVAKNIRSSKEGTTFDVTLLNNNLVQEVFIPLHGQHSVLNSLAVISTFIFNKLSIPDICLKNIATFKGAKRRFSVESINDTVIVDDYAHHPTEISATISAAKLKFPDKKIIAVFQPHTFSRTTAFLDEFADALRSADRVFGCPIFGSARESKGEVSIETMMSKLPNASVVTMESLNDLLEYKDEVLLFMGAGDITKYIASFKEML